jgi:hypothetical protein
LKGNPIENILPGESSTSYYRIKPGETKPYGDSISIFGDLNKLEKGVQVNPLLIDKEVQTDLNLNNFIIESVHPSPTSEVTPSILITPSILDSNVEGIRVISPSSYGSNINTQGITPFDSISQIPSVIGRSLSEGSGLKVNIDSPVEGVSPIDSIVEGLSSNMGRIPGGFPVSPHSTEPLRILPNFGVEGIRSIPLPESVVSPVESNIPLEFTRGRYSGLPLNVAEPFSETPIITPESTTIVNTNE